MRLTGLCLILAALTLPAWAGAQEQKEAEKQERRIEPEATAVYKVKYADVAAVYNALRAFNADMRYSSSLGVISVSGSKATVTAVGEAIKKIDVPSAATRNIELTFHILLATQETGEGGARALPESLDGVARQLREVLGIGSVRLIETALVRVRDGYEGQARGVLGEVGSSAAEYHIQFAEAAVTGSGEDVGVRLRKLSFRTAVQAVPGGPRRDVELSTNVDIGDGQKAVVGKAGVDGQGKHLILVVMAKVV